MTTRRPKPAGRFLLRRRRFFMAAALAAVLLVFSSFAAVHLVVSTRILRGWINTAPEELLLDYESGSSWAPGVIRLRGLTVRGSDRNVQWWFRMDEATISVSLVDLLRKRFHATSVAAKGLVFRLREKVETKELSAPHQARVPRIPGFSDPPWKTAGEQAPPPAVPGKTYWTIFVEGLDADPASEIWIELYRFSGHARVTGSFSLRPHVQVAVGPAAVKFLTGALTLGEKEPLLESATGLGTCVIDAYEPERVRGPQVWRHISGRMQMEGALKNLSFFNYFLGDAKEPILSGGAGRASATVDLNHGIGRGEVRFEARGTTAQYNKGSLSGHSAGTLAIARWDLEKNIMDISGSHVDLSDIVTSATARDERDWWGHFRFPSGQLHEGLAASTAIEARDARPLYTIFRANLPGWAQGILKLDGIQGTARVRVRTDLVEVRELEAQGGLFHIAGEYSQKNDVPRGAFLVERGILALGLEVGVERSRLHVLGARRWFEQARRGWGGPPDSPR
jgi:hypothetical protein